MNLTARGRGLVSTAALIGFAVVAATAAAGTSNVDVGDIVAPAQPSTSVVLVDEPAGAGAHGAARKASANARGYVLANSQLVGITPKGLTVWVAKGTKHDANIAQHAKAAVSLWRKWGIDATYGGYGTPKDAEGIIRITEGAAGCRGAANRVGNTWQYWMPLPNKAEQYVYGAKVVMCPKLWDYDKWQWSATIRHELGHTAGLGHFDGTYGGKTQVMRSVNHAPIATYQSGDINGLKFLSSHDEYVKKAIPAVGKFEKAQFVNSKVRLSGWAVLDYYKTEKVTIEVTDNGKVISRAPTSVVRLDVNKVHDPDSKRPHGFEVSFPWPGGTHEYCITAISPVNTKNRISLGCSNWS